MPNDPPTLADRTKEFYKHGNGGEFSKGEELNGRSAKTAHHKISLSVNNKNDPSKKLNVELRQLTYYCKKVQSLSDTGAVRA